MKYLWLLLALLAWTPAAWPQAEFRVYADHPRLWLSEERVQRLRKDVERRSHRWQQLEKLRERAETGPEQPLVDALRYQAAGDSDAAARAIAWLEIAARDASSLDNPARLRLAALVFDWTYELIPAEQRKASAAALGEAADSIARRKDLTASEILAAALGAIAAANDWSGSERVLAAVIGEHWQQDLLPAARKGLVAASAEDLRAVLELCHAVRYTLDRNLWEDAPEAFRTLPLPRILSYYPQPIETEWGYLHRPSASSTRPIDEREEAHSGRIAEMLLVAYENAGQPFQFLQGWLRNDRYSLKDPEGAFYEFLWVNPYLPGLSYSSGPVSVYDELQGRVFARGGWEGDDLWVGYFGGELQVMADGEIHVMKREDRQAPLLVAGAAVVLAKIPLKVDLHVPLGNPLFGEFVFVVGLEEGKTYDVRINKRPSETRTAGRGGVLVLQNSPDKKEAIVKFGELMRIQIRPT